MKFVIDGSDKEMGHITVETKDMPQNFGHMMKPIYEDGMLAGFVIMFCMRDEVAE